MPNTFGVLSLAGDAGAVVKPVGASGPAESSTYVTFDVEHADTLFSASVAMA